MTGLAEPARRGDRVELVRVDGYEWFRTPAGATGVVELVDSLATVHVRWDNGTRFGVIAGDVRAVIRAAPDPASDG